MFAFVQSKQTSQFLFMFIADLYELNPTLTHMLELL